jgi:2-keto-4-pentenoate hydratase/2-oxohepta-3-ene-1,7-dioic acid hydratase in catechol pathway
VIAEVPVLQQRGEDYSSARELNDVTARDLQRRDGQWTRAKSFDTFAPLGPYVVEADPSSLAIETRVNGRVGQSSNTSDLIFSIPELVEFISGIMTLLPGDVIASGTPPGVGSLSAGDVVEVEVEGLGVLRNPVVGVVEPSDQNRLS